jgi:hypothetical protein
MPGRCDAGRIRQATNDEFLLCYGFTQCIVDRRVFVKKDPVLGVLVLQLKLTKRANKKLGALYQVFP